MKNFYISLFIAYALICSQGNKVLAVGFNSIHSPDGGHVIAVGNQGNLYCSSDAGSTWSFITISSENLNSVYSIGNDVWICASNGNIYKTTNRISSVTSHNIGSTVTLNSVYFVNENTGFVCGDVGSLYKTINGGLNWSISSLGITSDDLNAVSFNDVNNGVAVSNGGKIFITTNGGSLWTPTVGITINDLLDVKFFNDGIIAVGNNGTILTKETAGSWNTVISRTSSDIRGVTGLSLNNARICGGGGFIRNNLNNRSNFFNFEINPMMANLVDIFYYNANTGFAVSSLNNAIIRTTNGGQSWVLPTGTTVSYNWVQKISDGFNGIGNTLCMHPKNKNSAFVVYGNKVYVSRDRSETWTQISTISIGVRAHSFYVSPNDTNIWLAAMESSPDCIVRSTNYGATWTNKIAYDFGTYGQPLEMDQNNSSTFYFAPSNVSGIGLFKSTNDGETFSLISDYNNPEINRPCDLIVMWDSSNVLYMGDEGADMFKSTNYGLNWILVKPASSSLMPSICNSVFDKSICYATTWSSSEVYKTTNYGDNWNIISTNSGSGWASDVCREDPTLVLTGSYGGQAYLSTNGGINFFNVNSGLSGGGVGIMVSERGSMLNQRTVSLYKLKVDYLVNSTGLPNIKLNNPANNSINNPYTINFNWKRDIFSVTYIFQLFSDSLLNNLIVSDTIYNNADTSKTVNDLTSFNKYYWRVGGKINSGLVYYSETWKFNTIVTGKILSIKIIPEGMFYPLFNQLSRKDTFTVYLRNIVSPFSKVDSANSIVDSLSFSGLFTFFNTPGGTYYIEIKHLNSIETWSKSGGESLTNNGSIYNYDFTTSATKAYGNNLKLKGGKYCIYSGDLDQDGIVDASDLSFVDNDSFAGLSGRYLRSDVNGDNYVDASDVGIVDNNRSVVISRPYF